MLAAVRKTSTTYFRFSLATAGVDGRRRLGHDHRGRVQGPRRLHQRRARVPVRPRRRHRAPVRPGRRRHDRHQRPQPAQLGRRHLRSGRPSGGLAIDVGSITDLAPEFVLAGVGLGTLALDAARAPTLRQDRGDTVTYRYWLTGVRGDGRDHAHLPAGHVGVQRRPPSTARPRRRRSRSPTARRPRSWSRCPTVAGLTLDPRSVDLGAFTGTISSSAVGWTIVLRPEPRARAAQRRPVGAARS